MKKSFGARRVPRKIGGDEDETSTPAQAGTDASSSDDQPPVVVKRPHVKNRKSSALRTSFAASQLESEDTEESSVITPKRNNLSRAAIHRNAEKRSGTDVPFRAVRGIDNERPSYSKDYLEELRHSTPSTPRDMASQGTPLQSQDDDQIRVQALDIASRFGTDLSRYQLPTAIPTDAEIKEKKERRARLAKEQGFISLDAEGDVDDDDDDDEEEDENVTRDDQGRLILKPKEKYPETRLVRDDEDVLEGFDDFTTDGRMTFGRAAEREAARRRKADMAAMIADAEGQSAEDDDDSSEAERNAEFETAQTRHGTYATRDQEDEDSLRPQTPPKIVALPTMDAVVERLRQKLREMETQQMQKVNEMQGLVDEKRAIAEQEVFTQKALKETGEKYEALRRDMGLLQAPAPTGEIVKAKDDDDDADDADGVWSEEDDTPRFGRAGLGSASVDNP